MTQRLLGIDLGERRIGLAVADTGTRAASPFATIRREKTVERDAATIRRIVEEQRIDALVVGFPLDMDGGVGAQAQRTREWAVRIARETGLPLRLRDERLTSERAAQRIVAPRRGRAGGPPTRGQLEAHRGRIDREAAAIILQDELDGATADGGGSFILSGAEPGPGSEGDR